MKYPIEFMCKVLKVSKSGYFSWVNRPISEAVKKNDILQGKISGYFLLSKMRYGSPRIHEDLKEEGIKCGVNRIARIMSENNMRARFKKKYLITTDSNHTHRISKNLMDRDFSSTSPNQKWVSDITYLRTRTGWLYLCVIIDLYSRKVVGWSIARHMETSLLIDAFLMAATSRKPPTGLLFHSDRGVQYASHEFRKLLSMYGVQQSMSRKGDCWDNACAESFFKTLKVEEIYRYNLLTEQQVKQKVFEYIEGYYNIRRRHSSIDYKSPIRFEKENG